MKPLLFLTVISILFLSGCGVLPENPRTIAGGAPGQVDYCVTMVGANLFCVNAKRTLDRE